MKESKLPSSGSFLFLIAFVPLFFDASFFDATFLRCHFGPKWLSGFASWLTSALFCGYILWNRFFLIPLQR